METYQDILNDLFREVNNHRRNAEAVIAENANKIASEMLREWRDYLRDNPDGLDSQRLSEFTYKYYFVCIPYDFRMPIELRDQTCSRVVDILEGSGLKLSVSREAAIRGAAFYLDIPKYAKEEEK